VRRSSSFRSLVAAGLVAALFLTTGAVPAVAQTGAAVSEQQVDLAHTAFASLFLGPLDAVADAQARMRDIRTMAAVAATETTDPASDVHGTVPSVIPPGLPDIQRALVLNLPQSADAAFSTACTSSPKPVLDGRGDLEAPTAPFWFCPVAGTPTQPLTIIALQLGAALPSSLALPGQQAIYVGIGRPDPAHPTGKDAFHAGIGDIYGAGLRHTGAWAPYFEGGALFPQFPAFALSQDAEGAVALIVAQTGLLANGFRPFVSVGPPKSVSDGAWDEVDGAAANRLLLPTQAPDEALAAVLAALGVLPSAAGTQVKSTFVPPLPFGLNGMAAAGPVDPMWAAIGRLEQPGSAPTIDNQFPCGQSITPGAGATTACEPGASASSLTVGPVDVYEAELTDPPLSGAGAGALTLEVALDSDGKTTDNWTAAAGQPGDPLQGTDRVYEATADPTTGSWSLAVKQLTDSAWTDATSAARVIVEGPSAIFVIPASELSDSHPGWRLIEHTEDPTTTPPSDVFLVSAGAPPDSWSLGATDDATNVARTPIAVTGGCVVAQPGIVPTLHFTATISGLEQAAFPRLILTITVPLPPGSGKKAITQPVAPAPVNGGTADFLVQVLPSRVRFNKAVIETGAKTIDVTRSWQKVFGSSFAVTTKGGQHAGNQCG
jgi:hypothetical protein